MIINAYIPSSFHYKDATSDFLKQNSDIQHISCMYNRRYAMQIHAHSIKELYERINRDIKRRDMSLIKLLIMKAKSSVQVYFAYVTGGQALL